MWISLLFHDWVKPNILLPDQLIFANVKRTDITFLFTDTIHNGFGLGLLSTWAQKKAPPSQYFFSLISHPTQ